jgi:hypothetical protein
VVRVFGTAIRQQRPDIEGGLNTTLNQMRPGVRGNEDPTVDQLTLETAR